MVGFETKWTFKIQKTCHIFNSFLFFNKKPHLKNPITDYNRKYS